MEDTTVNQEIEENKKINEYYVEKLISMRANLLFQRSKITKNTTNANLIKDMLDRAISDINKVLRIIS